MPTKNNIDIFSGWWEIWCVVHDHGHPEQDIFENFHATQKKSMKSVKTDVEKSEKTTVHGGEKTPNISAIWNTSRIKMKTKFIQNQKHFDIKKTSINDINLNTNQKKNINSDQAQWHHF